jgi:hypothetical protein
MGFTSNDFTLSLFSVEISIPIFISLLLLFPPPLSTASNHSNLRTSCSPPAANRSPISLWAERLIRQSVSSYIDACLGSDFLLPQSHQCLNHSGLSLTAVDSLDTLLIIGARDLYERLHDFVLHSFSCRQNHYLSFHDLCVHVIGGLLSAYSLSRDSRLLAKAVECGDVALSAFSRAGVPHPLVHGQNRSIQGYSWAPGISLSEASSFILEFQALGSFSGRRRYGRSIRSLLRAIEKHMRKFQSLPLFVKWDGTNGTEHSGLSPLNVEFIANLIRLQIVHPNAWRSQLIGLILGMFKERSLRVLAKVTNSTESRFDSSFCQLLPLFETISYSKEIVRKLDQACQLFADQILPAVSAVWEKHNLGIDEDGFQFDTSLLELSLLRNGDFMGLEFLHLLSSVECEEATCGFHSQKDKVFYDLMPPQAINKWLKLCYLDGMKLKYDNLVLNEVGHLITASDL